MAERLKERPQELTKAELEIMQIMWDKERALIRDILDAMSEPKPAYNTVSTVVRVLEKKGYVAHKAYGTTYEYYPLIGREAYTSRYMNNVLSNFFGGSIQKMLCFFSDSKSISVRELEKIVRMIKDKK